MIDGVGPSVGSWLGLGVGCGVVTSWTSSSESESDGFIVVGSKSLVCPLLVVTCTRVGAFDPDSPSHESCRIYHSQGLGCLSRSGNGLGWPLVL